MRHLFPLENDIQNLIYAAHGYCHEKDFAFVEARTAVRVDFVRLNDFILYLNVLFLVPFMVEFIRDN